MQSSSTSPFNVENELYSLDINQYYGQSSDSFNNKWNLVTSSNSFDVEVRRTPESAALADGKSFILVGGQNLGSTGNNLVFVNQTILYNAVENTWETLPAYSETNRTERQIYFGTASNLPSASQDTIGFYGGFEDRSNTSSPMVSVYGTVVPVSSDNTTSVRGFDSLTVFNTTSKTWSHFAPQSNIPKNFYLNSQTATLNPKTGKIYYMGGSYYTPLTGYRFPFSESYVFDTTQGSWSLVKLSAAPTSRIPSDRIYHSTTMMPNSEDILLYGGTNNGQLAATDFCYTLNLTTNVWTEQVNVSVPTSVTSSGARFGHSVNTTLFIIFGKDLNGSPNPNLLTFDISNISNIQYTSTYPLQDTDTTSSNSTTQQGTTSSLSGGAKAGIAIGCVVGVAAIVAGAILFYRKKSKRSNGRFNQDDQNVMHVDWDKIESQYKEVQAPPVYTSSSARPSAEMSRQTPDVHDSISYEKPMSYSKN
ncbi:hypothetical protein CU098_009612 [Rhizopus stolonifer]|uniref:Galactose oxidase n=1 Tax=Rhizopus stolonifer TaxID=4846 RepID=A0A367KHQ8_RHIST|nr:hypothetical protein CU098_009612 [Rhizopus stolonifer]